MNRIKSIRKWQGLSQTEFGKMFNVDQTAVSNWEKGKNSIDVTIAQSIGERFNLPLDFVYGVPFKVTREQSEWYEDEIEDYGRLPSEGAEVLLFKYGRGVFSSQESSAQKKNTPEEAKLSEGEETILQLFRQIPEDRKAVVLAMIRAALQG